MFQLELLVVYGYWWIAGSGVWGWVSVIIICLKGSRATCSFGSGPVLDSHLLARTAETGGGLVV